MFETIVYRQMDYDLNSSHLSTSLPIMSIFPFYHKEVKILLLQMLQNVCYIIMRERDNTFQGTDDC